MSYLLNYHIFQDHTHTHTSSTHHTVTVIHSFLHVIAMQNKELAPPPPPPPTPPYMSQQRDFVVERSIIIFAKKRTGTKKGMDSFASWEIFRTDTVSLYILGHGTSA